MTRPRLRSPAGARGGPIRREIGAIGASALLVLRRVRTDLVAVLGIATLIALTAVLAVMVPSYITATLDQAAREAVAAAGADADLRLLATTGDAAGGNPNTAERLLTFSTEVPDLWPTTLSEVASQLSVGIIGPEVAGRIAVGTARVRIGVLDPATTSALQVVSGDLPPVGTEPVPATATLPVVISAAAADATAFAVGDSFTVGEASLDEDILLTVVAVVDTVDTTDQAWTDLPGLWDPQALTSQGMQTGERFTVLTDAAGFDSVSARFPETAAATLRTSFDPSRFDLQRFIDVRESIDALETSSGSLTESSPVSVSVSSDYERVLEAFPAAAAAARAQLSTLAAGLLGVAVLVTILASTALTRRRHAEIELLRSRGASLPLIVSHSAGESIAVTLLGTGVGVTVAALLGFRAGSPLLLAVTAGVFALTPVLSTLSHALASPSRRFAGALRVAGVSALVATTVTAVVALRSGAGEADGSIDPLSLAAPILCAGVVALALAPLPTVVLRFTSAFTARTRGPATLLAGASARDGRALVTLVALTLAVSVGVTSLVLLHTVASGQEAASWRAVGADVRVEGAPDPTALVREFADAGATAAAVVERRGLTLEGRTATTRATLLEVDDDYARLLSALPGAEPSTDAVAVEQLLQQSAVGDVQGQDPLPVLADRRLAAQAGDDSVTFDIGGVLVPVTVVGSFTATEPTAVVDRARLDAYLETNTAPAAPAGSGAQPPAETVLAVGSGANRVAASATATGADEIVLRSDVLAQLRDGALVAGVASATALSLLGTALLAVLALVTTTVIGVQRRGRVLALLGALGVPKRTGVALAVGELAPLVVSGVVGGCLASAAVLTLAGDAFASEILAGGAAPLTVSGWLPLSVLAAAAAALALAIAIDTPLSRRVRTADILRTGEES
ncbi:ABC transporter permease [Cryobacterium lactosi]|uniref:ABC transporter permease n=1 Tax=Cryobacterium lactosi TaxID=1259202 RepID=A0A4R9BMC1_9MICO|nr:FtsX-like permease family protein [Cryobacterium lactosi]TFD87096.1 ABC transporter permease [Cryobacterium lactosi]